ncbi:hypothetical protein CFIMG_007235RA00001 [Ceratocystis fimbriata CBS 114723]|uniref:Uncharacterized protein n=1 Tax=Ceratocystis fimbriata CBS 114723 TaxID=1035309 RepID=A0A2C5WZW8_9PEZI|nr:hypothetical protein CFIMG_007235RA00001 [Ceratocystis fimbriata CBS 114723]
MRFSSLLPVPLLMLVGVNAGSAALERCGYKLQKLDGGVCTITTRYYDQGNRPVDKFTIDQENQIITINEALNSRETVRYDQMALHEILIEVCSEYGLVPDTIKSVAMDAAKDRPLISFLKPYREYYSIPDGEYVRATITPNIAEDWILFTGFWLYSDVNGILTRSNIEEIRVEEKETTCSFTYIIH